MLRPLFLIALTITATPVPAQSTNPQIDYPGFQELTGAVGSYRQSHLLSWPKFKHTAGNREALLLDARSADAYAAGHIKGAVNLPFTDFTAKSLAQVIGDKDRAILIYCNNNFANDEQPVPMKRRELALNIQTFINLVGYGYRNVWELSEVVDFNDPNVGWVRGAPALAKTGR